MSIRKKGKPQSNSSSLVILNPVLNSIQDLIQNLYQNFYRFRVKPGMTDKGFSFLLLLIIILRLGSYVFTQSSSFQKFNPEAHKKAYLGSTYAMKEGAPISDYIVYGHAAWEYIHGQNPTLINPEMPPLGKYLMGLSILLCQRIAVGSLIFGLLSLILVFLIGKIILKSATLSLIPVILLVFEPLFINQLDTALLDIYHLFFILLAFYFFLLAQEKQNRHPESDATSDEGSRFFGFQPQNDTEWVTPKKVKYYLFASLALGGVMAVKFYSTGLIMALAWIIFLAINKNYQGLRHLLMTLPLALLVLIASYFRIFLEGESLRRFFGIQKWIWHFHSSGKFLVPPGAIWQLIFFKKWVTWWGDRRPLPAPDWQITWPISIVFSLGMGICAHLRGGLSPGRCLHISPSRCERILFIWIVVYLLSLSFGIAYPRYLLPLLPFTYIISVSAFLNLRG